MTLSNPGGHEDLHFTVHEINRGAVLEGAPAAAVRLAQRRAGRPPATPGRPGTPRRASPRRSTGDPSLVLMDVLPWDSTAIQDTLAPTASRSTSGARPRSLRSTSPATTPSTSATTSRRSFYDAYQANIDKFSAFVAGGGFLWFGSAAFGFQDGNLDGVALPGGLTIHGPQFEDENTIDAPGHPLVAGVPDPLSGSSASHVTFADLPDGATVDRRRVVER